MTTVYEFELPRGYTDERGGVYKRGKMRLATAGDEITAARDPRVLSNPAYLAVVLLARVITELDGIDTVTASLIENLYTADLAYLQDMYQRINDIEPPMIRAVCPKCGEVFQIPLNFTQEG